MVKLNGQASLSPLDQPLHRVTVTYALRHMLRQRHGAERDGEPTSVLAAPCAERANGFVVFLSHFVTRPAASSQPLSIRDLGAENPWDHVHFVQSHMVPCRVVSRLAERRVFCHNSRTRPDFCPTTVVVVAAASLIHGNTAVAQPQIVWRPSGARIPMPLGNPNRSFLTASPGPLLRSK